MIFREEKRKRDGRLTVLSIPCLSPASPDPRPVESPLTSAWSPYSTSLTATCTTIAVNRFLWIRVLLFRSFLSGEACKVVIGMKGIDTHSNTGSLQDKWGSFGINTASYVLEWCAVWCAWWNGTVMLLHEGRGGGKYVNERCIVFLEWQEIYYMPV